MIGVVCRCGGVRTNGVCNRCGPVGRHDKTTKQRGYDNRWRRLSERVRKASPLCVVCEQEGRVRAATEVHHVVPIKVDRSKRFEADNLMPVCRECHERLENATAPRGTVFLAK